MLKILSIVQLYAALILYISASQVAFSQGAVSLPDFVIEARAALKNVQPQSAQWCTAGSILLDAHIRFEVESLKAMQALGFDRLDGPEPFFEKIKDALIRGNCESATTELQRHFADSVDNFIRMYEKYRQ